jgi:archaeosine synthase
VNCLGALSYHRPDFQIFRERTIVSFEPEQQTKLIILFPCSAGKPYSESKSHKKFLSVLRKYSDFPDFQEMILTSPLGAIPRQLENIYPANSYDISVTGEWNEEELKISCDMLVKLLEKYNPGIPVVSHLEGGYLEVVNRAKRQLKNEFYFTEITKNLTTKESLHSLKSLIDTKRKEFSPDETISKELYLSKSWDRKFKKILDYQFGKGSGVKILKNEIKIRKTKHHTKIQIIDSKDNNSLGFFNYGTGQIDLTINGAYLLRPFSELTKIIVFNGKKMSGNTLFRPGILDFSENLIPYENIVILDKDKENIIGMGHLIVGSNVIKNTKTGRVATVYENAK